MNSTGRVAWAGALLLATMATAQVTTPAAADARRAGLAFMSPATQALQLDDAQNPAFLWVQAGRQRFAVDCQGCHTTDSMVGVAARFPAFDSGAAKPVTLAGRIQACQQRHVRGAPLAAESDALISLEAFIAHRSRGLPITPPTDARLAPWQQQGQRLYNQRIGQLDLSCADCHDAQAGRRLGGSTIPQAHPTGYPIYRLEWQGLGSLQRRLRGCLSGVRAQPWAFGSDELTALELHLMQRAAGMTMDSPAVRP